jgi:hypothetical protein
MCVPGRHVFFGHGHALRRRTVVALPGPRQTGQTTLAPAVAEETDALYLDLEAPADRARRAGSVLLLRPLEQPLVACSTRSIARPLV